MDVHATPRRHGSRSCATRIASQIIKSITDGRLLSASFPLQNFGLEWIVKEYVFAPDRTWVWLHDDRVLAVHPFTGDPEADLRRTDLASIAPEQADSIGLSSLDFSLMDFRARKRAKSQYL